MFYRLSSPLVLSSSDLFVGEDSMAWAADGSAVAGVVCAAVHEWGDVVGFGSNGLAVGALDLAEASCAGDHGLGEGLLGPPVDTPPGCSRGRCHAMGPFWLTRSSRDLTVTR